MIKTILGRPAIAVSKPSLIAGRAVAFQANASQTSRPSTKLQQLQKQQGRLMRESMTTPDPLSSLLKKRGDLLATRINKLKNKSYC